MARIFARSLSLQASWSFEGMQSLGFAYAMAPALAKLGRVGVQDGEHRSRHLEFFNTHPFLACAILGCVVRLEEEGEAEAAQRVKGMLMGPCGAIGDSLYWGALKPLIMLAAVLAALRGASWAPWLFVALFGVVNLGGRLLFFAEGYREGMKIAERLGQMNLLGWSRRIKGFCAVLLGLVVTGSTATWPGAMSGGPRLWLGSAGGATIALVLAWAYRRGVRPVWTVYLTAALSAVILAWT